MKLRIFAEDKPAEKVFEYQLELDDQTILLSTVLFAINSTLVWCHYFSRDIRCFERKIKIEKRKLHGFTKF